MGRFITLDENMKVITIRQSNSIVEGEIESDLGQLGQIMQSDGTFIDDPQPQPDPPEPLDSRLARIEDTQDLILLKLEGII